MIPRLSPDANDLTVSITVNKRLRPYFTQWYQATKLTDETPEQFALRYLKVEAMQWYKQPKIKIENDQAETDRQTTLNAIGNDEELLMTEVDG